VAEIQQQVSELSSHGHRRFWGLLLSAYEIQLLPIINVKWVYRVMRDYSLIRQLSMARCQEGRIAVKPAINVGARTALSSDARTALNSA
jgi:hypothetical protein